jgi:lysozyme
MTEAVLKLSLAGLDLIKSMESCDLTAYRDQGGVWTIGWGHTGPQVTAGLIWTQAQADAALEADLDSRAAKLAALVTGNLGDHQFSALLSLGYNIGISALASSAALRHANEGSLAAVPAAIAIWNKITVKGVKQVNRGLVGRRAAECALWSLPDNALPPFPDWNAIREAAVTQFVAGEV